MHVHRLSCAVIALYTITASSAPATTWDESELDVRGLFSSSKNKHNGGESSRTGTSSSSGQCQKTTARGIDFDVDIVKRIFGSSKPTICGVTAAPTQQSCKSFSADESSDSEQASTSGGRTSNKRGFLGSSRTQETQTNGDSTGYTPLDPKLGKKATVSTKKILLALQKQSSICDNAVELPLIDQVMQENTICQAFTYFSKVIQPSLNPFSKKAKALMMTWLEGPIALANGKSVKSSTATGSSRGSNHQPGGLRSRLVSSGSGSVTENTEQGNNFWKVEPSVYKSKKAIAVKALVGTSSTAASTTESTDEGASVAEYLSNSEVQESEKAFSEEFATAVSKAIEEAYQQARSCGKKKDKSKIEAQWAKVKSAKTLVQQGIDHYFEAMVTAAGADDSESTAEEPVGDKDGATGSDGVPADPSDPENTSDTLDGPDTDPTTSTSDGTSNPHADGPDGLETQEPDADQQSTYGGDDTLGSESTGGKGGLDSDESDAGGEEYGSSQGEAGDGELDSGSGKGKNNHGSGDEDSSESQNDAESGGQENSGQEYGEEEPIGESYEEHSSM
ncbi:hypothetical protein ARMGADRAFT_1162467 [Armillaria gallica]|uniref:Uncharacterized protein n=1 Tax=Armillaria gallica TaxID=47427 RepID=A0A2H3E3B5_ARMGA|nr:hypothetical protein ARMGADRAFT_1162467 [Armillaria gallica]